MTQPTLWPDHAHDWRRSWMKNGEVWDICVRCGLRR
jgi:hypothetical protein